MSNFWGAYQMRAYRPEFHQSVLTILAVHSERLPHNYGSTQYAYAYTDDLTNAQEIQHDHDNESPQQTSCKEEEVLRFQAFELYRASYTFIDFPRCHRLQEEASKNSSCDNQEDTRPKPRGCGLARIWVT